MSRRRNGNPVWPDVGLDGPYVMIVIYCRQHPTRRLAAFARPVSGHGTEVKTFVNSESRSAPRPDGGHKVYVRCPSCRIDVQWRTDVIAEQLSALVLAERYGVTRIEV